MAEDLTTEAIARALQAREFAGLRSAFVTGYLIRGRLPSAEGQEPRSEYAAVAFDRDSGTAQEWWEIEVLSSDRLADRRLP